MKKFAFGLIACLAMVQSAYAITATSPLINSLTEYEAITDAIGAPSFDVIPSTEFIVDIKRITRRIDITGEVRYAILTRSTITDPWSEDHESNVEKGHHHRHYHVIKYIATLLVTQNSGVGPNTVTVLSIDRVDHHHHDHDD